MGMKRFSMERRALHDRCAVANNLRRCVEDSVCWHANQRAIDVFPLTKESDDRNMSEVMRQPFDSTCWSPYKCRDDDVMSQANSLDAGLSESPYSDDRKTQWFRWQGHA